MESARGPRCSDSCRMSSISSFSNNNTFDLKTSFLAAFAQHPQFINNSEINFKELGLENSLIHQEYNYLLSLPGCSINDMSILYLDHAYPSTIADALKEDSLFTIETNASIPALPLSQPDITSHAHINCPC